MQKDTQINDVYKSKTGYNAGEANKLWAHSKLGCGGLKKHKTAASKNFLYANETTGGLLLRKEAWWINMGTAVVEGPLIDFLVTKMKTGTL